MNWVHVRLERRMNQLRTVAAMNWQGSSSADVDLTGIVTQDTAYRAKDAFNFLGPDVFRNLQVARCCSR